MCLKLRRLASVGVVVIIMVIIMVIVVIIMVIIVAIVVVVVIIVVIVIVAVVVAIVAITVVAIIVVVAVAIVAIAVIIVIVVGIIIIAVVIVSIGIIGIGIVCIRVIGVAIRLGISNLRQLCQIIGTGHFNASYRYRAIRINSSLDLDGIANLEWAIPDDSRINRQGLTVYDPLVAIYAFDSSGVRDKGCIHLNGSLFGGGCSRCAAAGAE
jgi:hypothetical protein